MKSETLFLFGGCSGSFATATHTRLSLAEHAANGFEETAFQRDQFGGATTCFFIRHRNTILIIDQGTGIETVCALVEEMFCRDADLSPVVHCLQTHYHFDHVNGLLRNRLFNRSDLVLKFYSPQFESDIGMDGVLRQLFCEPLWPLTFDQLPVNIEHQTFVPGESLTIDGIAIDTIALRHPGGCTGYRLNIDSAKSIVVATDYEPVETPDADVVAFVESAQLLVCDMQFQDDEFRGEAPLGGVTTSRANWGHAAPCTLLPVLAACRKPPQQIRITHHDPNRDDAGLLAFEKQSAAVMPAIRFARQAEAIWL